MPQLTREFTFQIHRARPGEGTSTVLYDESYAVEIRAQLQKSCSMRGMVHCLGVLQTTIGAWIKNAWDKKLMLTKAEQPLNKALLTSSGQQVIPTVFLAQHLTAQGICDYLLAEICEPRLRIHGLMVDQVRCHKMGFDWCESTLPSHYVQRYLARHPMPAEYDQDIHLPVSH